MSSVTTDPDPVLSVSAAARLIGVSASSLRAWAAEGKVPHERTTGGHRRFRRSDLDSWLTARGARLPGIQPRATELLAARAEPLPAIAAAIADALDDVVDAAESAAAPGIRHSRRRARRRGRLESQVRALIYAVESGDLGGYLREAEWNGFRQGASGASDDGPLVDAVALRWAVGAVVGPGLAGQPPRDVRALHRSLDRLVVRVVSGLADGLRARNEATHVEH